MKKAYGFALLASLFWGAGFIGSKYALGGFDAMWVTFFRFFIATVFLLPFVVTSDFSELDFKFFRKSFFCGFLLMIMMFLQIKGIEYTTIAKSGFITTTHAFITPILSYIFFKDHLTKFFLSMVLISFAGIALLCEMDFNSLNLGDLLTFIGAVCTSFQLIYLSHSLGNVKNVGLFNLIQMFAVSTCAFVLAFIFEGSEPLWNLTLYTNKNAVAGLIFMGIFSTTIAFYLQVKCQKILKGHVAGVIYLIESPIAAVLGFLFFNELLSLQGVFGSFLVMFAIVLLLFEKEIKRKFITV